MFGIAILSTPWYWLIQRTIIRNVDELLTIYYDIDMFLVI